MSYLPLLSGRLLWEEERETGRLSIMTQTQAASALDPTGGARCAGMQPLFQSGPKCRCVVESRRTFATEGAKKLCISFIFFFFFFSAERQSESLLHCGYHHPPMRPFSLQCSAPSSEVWMAAVSGAERSDTSLEMTASLCPYRIEETNRQKNQKTNQIWIHQYR